MRQIRAPQCFESLSQLEWSIKNDQRDGGRVKIMGVCPDQEYTRAKPSPIPLAERCPTWVRDPEGLW